MNETECGTTENEKKRGGGLGDHGKKRISVGEDGRNGRIIVRGVQGSERCPRRGDQGSERCRGRGDQSSEKCPGIIDQGSERFPGRGDHGSEKCPDRYCRWPR